MRPTGAVPGARALRGIIEDLMLDCMMTSPTGHDVSTFTGYPGAGSSSAGKVKVLPSSVCIKQQSRT